MEPRIQRGELTVEHPGDGIRKIDGLVEGDSLFQELGLHPNIRGILTQILGPDIKMFRNALLLKPPAVGSAKGMHQDSPYWPIRPMDLCSCWFPLDNATLENGCMAVLVGGHRRGPLPHVHVQDDYVVPEALYDAEDMALLPMQAGDGLFFHSLLPHYTAPNRSARWRRAIALSYMSAQARYTGKATAPRTFACKVGLFQVACNKRPLIRLAARVGATALRRRPNALRHISLKDPEIARAS